MGEIGIDHHTFYYELKWWEVKAIIRGYNARHHHSWEQARLVAYNAHFCMGSKNPIPIITKWLPFPWEKEETKSLTKEEQDDLLADIAAENARIAESQK